MATKAKPVKSKKAGSKAKPRRKVAAPLNPTQFRKLTKAELAKLGLGEKTERYVKRDLKRITKKTKTIAKRQYLKAQRFGLSNERYAKLMASGPRFQKFEKTPGGRDMWDMPLSEPAFDARMVKIRAYYANTGKKHGYCVLTYHDGRSLSTINRFLSSITWANSVDAELAAFSSKYQTGLALASLVKIELWVKID